jgi:23S rRNA (guanosine2251-2'-O)-methyltransferase
MLSLLKAIVMPKFPSKSGSEYFIYGKHPVLAAIKNPARKINKLFLTAKSQQELQNQQEIFKIIKAKNIPIKILTNQEISHLLQGDIKHQSFLLNTEPLQIKDANYIFNEIRQDSIDKLLILDQLTDPQNFGAIIRSAIAFGYENIIIARDNACKDSGIVAKASAGMLESSKIYQSNNLNSFIKELKKYEFWILGLDSHSKTKINQAPNYTKFALIIGNEGKGVRKLVKENCDLLLNIPLSEKVESLNASVAAAISMFALANNKITIL